MKLKINKLFNFSKKIVVITGTSGQLGKYLTEFFIDNGSIVYGIDIKKSSNKIKFIKCDITNEKNLNIAIDKIYKKEKKINIYINNAGRSIFSHFLKRSKAEFMSIIDTNLYSPFFSIKKLSKKAKIKDKLKIINISSIYGLISPDFKIYAKGDRFSPEVYGASKAGLVQITKYFANLLAKKNININCISPGGIKNIKLQKNSFIKRYVQNVPKKRMANPIDMITAIAFLSSDYSDYITGQNIIVDGGLLLK